MTFSIAGTCSDTGEIGYAVATSSVCVGARVGMAGPGLCVVFSQARTDPRLHQVGFDAFRRTHDAKAALTPDLVHHRQRTRVISIGSGFDIVGDEAM